MLDSHHPTRSQIVVLTLHIRHEVSHHFLARVFDGRELVGLPTDHTRIDEAIASYGELGAQRFLGVTAFAIWYDGWSVGEVPLGQMRTDAANLANRLVVLSAVLR
jgi:hypothetical protein